MARKHRKAAEEHTCPRCGATFSRARILQAHIEAQHGRAARVRRLGAVAAVALAAAGVAAAVMLLGDGPAPGAVPGLDLDGEPKLGSDDAPVVFVLLEDGDCPFCRRFHQQTLDALLREYADTGKVQFFFKNNDGGNPLFFDHAIAMECVHRGGGDAAFWPYLGSVYEGQDAVRANPGNAREKVRAFLMGQAGGLGLDAAALGRCFDANEPAGEVADDLRDARALGARGTPAFVVMPRAAGEPQLVVGAQPTDTFRTAIEVALSRAASASPAPPGGGEA